MKSSYRQLCRLQQALLIIQTMVVVLKSNLDRAASIQRGTQRVSRGKLSTARQDLHAMDWLKSVCAPFSSNQSVWEKVREGHGSEGPWHDDDHWWACRPGSCCEARASTRTTRPKQTPAHTHNRWRPEGLCCGRKDARASSIPSLAGVGIVFRARDGHLLVAEVTADGPAQQSGKVVPGQKLLMMSGTRVAGLDTTDIAGLVLGPVGSHAELVLENADSSVVRVQLVRRKTRETMPLVHTRRQRQASSPSAHSTSRKHQEELLEMAHEQV